MEKPDFFLVVSLLLVFTSILLPVMVNLVLWLVLVGYLLSIPLVRRRRWKLKPWLARLNETVSNRLQFYPTELLLVVSLGGLIMLRHLETAGRWWELALCLQVILTYSLSRRGNLIQSGYGRRRWRLFRKVQRDKEGERPPAVAANSAAQAAAEHEESNAQDPAIAHRQAWEEKQQKRWEEWMQEELDRLNGEYKSDHGS